MLSSYLRIAWRSLRKRFGYMLINVLGLSVGLAACLLIGLWVNHELSYDDFHPDAERIRRVLIDVKVQDRTMKGPVAPAPLASTLRQEIPEVATSTRVGRNEQSVFRVDDRMYSDRTVLTADSLFFQVFGGFELLHGNRETALQTTNGIVLTAETARTLYGTTNAVGKTLERADTTERVTGVLKTVPKTSHMQFDAIATSELSPRQRSLWISNNWYTYVKLTPGASVAAFEKKMGGFVEKYVAPQVNEVMGVPFNQLLEQGQRYQYFSQPLPSIHLRSNYQYEMEANGSIAYVYTFSAIALFILLIACVNFMNLATARASERATEVGMRKALGAYRWQLSGQFLGEAILTTAVAAVLALGITAVALPSFNSLAGKAIATGHIFTPLVLLGGVAFVAIVGLIAGTYPAFVLSRYEPSAVLKSDDRHRTIGGAKRLRQTLVVVQFAISIVLIVGTLVVQDQFAFIQKKRLGLDKERIATIDRAWALGEAQAGVARRVASLADVDQAATGDAIFRGGMSNTVFIPENAPSTESHSFNYLSVGHNFVETLGLELVEGRVFSPNRPADSSAVIINRAAADVLGWANPTQHRLRQPGFGGEQEFNPIIGVVEDFHYESMRQKVRPLVLVMDDVNTELYVRTKPGAAASAIESVRRAWTEAAPDEPFEYTFVDQRFAELHRDTQRTGSLFRIFAGLAIVIACLGLFGLATYTAQRRAKEIGIRKALGATSFQVVGLLSREFLQLVVIAFAVALPVSYFAMNRWLQDFAYRTELGVGVFALAAVLAVGVTFLTVSYQAFRAARIDPATTLRDE